MTFSALTLSAWTRACFFSFCASVKTFLTFLTGLTGFDFVLFVFFAVPAGAFLAVVLLRVLFTGDDSPTAVFGRPGVA